MLHPAVRSASHERDDTAEVVAAFSSCDFPEVAGFYRVGLAGLAGLIAFHVYFVFS